MEDRFSDQVIDALENSFGEVENKSSFENAIVGIAETVVQDNYSDYLEQLFEVCAGSYLEELDSDNKTKEFRNLPSLFQVSISAHAVAEGFCAKIRS